jgi:restriction system protein
LKKTGFVRQPKRGVVEITDEGKRVLENPPARIDGKFLKQFPSYREFRQRGKSSDSVEPPEEETQTPEESIDGAYQSLREALADELLEQVKACSPAFLERLVVELLVAMGYGGSITDAGKAIGRTGDGGIDGIIKEDRLGLDIVVIQAKRWSDKPVGRPDVQAFAGSMEPHRAKKGVFITTSTFSEQAHEYVKLAERKIVLIDGATLANLMIDHNIGVTTYRSFVLKRLD